MVAGLPPRARQPLRLDRAAQPARLRRASRSPRRWRSGSAPGVCFYYVPLDGQSPSRFTNGRVGAARGAVPRAHRAAAAPARPSTTPSASWEAAREAVDAGRPALLLTDLYYLDHYGRSAHFPGHAVVLAGYDDELAYLSDTGFDELQTTRLENLAQARHGDAPGLPARRPACSPCPRAPSSATRARRPRRGDRAQRAARCSSRRWASTRACRRCAASPPRSASGPSEVEDWQWCARFGYQVIERRGTGGGNFRLMYSRFLAEAGRERGGARGARRRRRWTALAGELLARERGRATPTRPPGRAIGDAAARGARDRGAALGRRSPASSREQPQHRALDPLALDELARVGAGDDPLAASRGSSRRCRSGRRRAGRCRPCGRPPGCC